MIVMRPAAVRLLHPPFPAGITATLPAQPNGPMTSSPPTLLLTRPRRQSERFLSGCRAQAGFEFPVEIAPVIDIQATEAKPDLTQYAGVVLTSENALINVPVTGGRGKTAFCVGDATRAAAERMGFRSFSARGDSEALINLIVARRPRTPLLHMRGAHTRGDISKRLTAAGVKTDQIVVYRQIPMELKREVIARLQQTDRFVAPLFSPRSAAVLAAAIRQTSLVPDIVAISQSAADSWDAASRTITVANRPDGRAMTEAVVSSLRS
jgi:uroporphyrinogen-III synthase